MRVGVKLSESYGDDDDVFVNKLFLMKFALFARFEEVLIHSFHCFHRRRRVPFVIL